MGTIEKVTIEKYPAYKDSGIEWLGKIPENWKATRVKRVFRLVIEPAPKNNDFELLSVYTDIGVKPRAELEERGNKASTTDGYWFVKKGDIVVNKLLAWMGAIGVSNYDGVTSPAYDILRAKVQINSNFYHYLFRNEACVSELRKHSRGIMDMRLRLYFDKFGDVVIPFPRFSEQQKIVAFLDSKVFLIDKAIGIKEEQIELLKERRQILIHKVVTRGLNPNVKLKDSGVEWIGEIPEHWEVKRLKTLLQDGRDGIRIGPFGSSIKSEILKLFGLKIYGQEHVIADDFNIGGKYIDDNDFRRLSNYELFAGDIVITMMGTTGKSKVVPIGIERGIMDSHLIRVRTKINEANPEFVSFLINDSPYIFTQIKLRSKGSIMEGLNSSIVKSLHLLLPPINEQKLILTHIYSFNKKFNTAISLKEQEIEKLKEYKATLINSAVTGKIKVC